MNSLRQLKSVLVSLLRYGVEEAYMFATPKTKEHRIVNLLESLKPQATLKPMIRLGPPGDGGYLVPDDLAGIRECFSPGVSDQSGFEVACADLGMEVYLADYSVDGPAAHHPRLHFSKKFVGVTSNDEFMTLGSWVASSSPSSTADLLLQMDIEGYEYETLLSASERLLRRFRIMIVEFHSLDNLWSEPFFNIASRTFERILETHACVHLHPNNSCGALKRGEIEIPRVMEFTFLRRDRGLYESFQTQFPHPLDFDNTSNAPLHLPTCWYK